MSNRLRYKGRFIKDKVLAQRLKSSLRAKKNKENIKKAGIDTTTDNLCDGRRIVDLQELGRHLKCNKCKQVLSLERIVNEKRMGLNSVLTVLCETCSVTTLVPTGKIHAIKHHSDVNTKAVLGTVHAEIGCTELNPTISPNLVKQYEREIGPAIEETAKDSCKRAAEEERQLVLTNIDKLGQELSNEIIEDI